MEVGVNGKPRESEQKRVNVDKRRKTMSNRIMVVDDVRLGRVDVKGKGAALKVAKARYSRYTVTKVVPYMGHTSLHDVYGHPKGFTSSGKFRG